MTNENKITQLHIDNVNYDIDLPIDATPTIKSLTLSDTPRNNSDAVRKDYVDTLDANTLHKGSSSSPAPAEVRYGTLTNIGNTSIGSNATASTLTIYSNTSSPTVVDSTGLHVGGTTGNLPVNASKFIINDDSSTVSNNKAIYDATKITYKAIEQGAYINYNLTFPTKTGVIALIGDVPTNLTNGSGENSLQQKSDNIASGVNSFAEGSNTRAVGNYSHAEGSTTEAGKLEGNDRLGQGSHAEGFSTKAYGDYSHAEGRETIASGEGSHAEGYNTTAANDYQTVVGKYNDNKATSLFEVGNGSDASHKNNAFVVYEDGHATVGGMGNNPGNKTITTKEYVDSNLILKSNATNLGNGTGTNSLILLSSNNTASAAKAIALGNEVTASGSGSFATGNNTLASGNYSYAEGYSTAASGIASHTEGHHTSATGNYSHAEGEETTASGVGSHAEGYNTTAGYDYQLVLGNYNNNKSTTLLEVGNGTSGTPNNAFEVYQDGHAEVGLMGSTNSSVATKQYVDDRIVDDSVLVHIDGAEVIHGEKTFNTNIMLNGGEYTATPYIGFVNDSGTGALLKDGTALKISHTGISSQANYTLTFPTSTGTLVRAEDLKHLYRHRYTGTVEVTVNGVGTSTYGTLTILTTDSTIYDVFDSLGMILEHYLNYPSGSKAFFVDICVGGQYSAQNAFHYTAVNLKVTSSSTGSSISVYSFDDQGVVKLSGSFTPSQTNPVVEIV